MFLKDFFNWLLPHKCLVCSSQTAEKSIFCPKCFSQITMIDYPFCKICGKILEISFDANPICELCSNHQRTFNIARSLFEYDLHSRKIVMKIKKQADNDAAKICCQMIYNRYVSLFKNVDYIVPVPSHWTRVLKRGYNPATIIAVELSRASKIPLLNTLKRAKKTAYQKGKNFQERYKNVEGVFQCSKDLLNKTIILVDDVLTTGATLEECSKALKKRGCKEIRCVTIASTKSLYF